MRRIINIAVAFVSVFSISATRHNPVANPEAVVTEGTVRFTVLTPEMIRIEYSPSEKFEDRATFTVVNRNLPVPHFTKSEDNDFLYITTDKLKLRYRKGTNPYFEPNPPGNLNITMDLNGTPVTWFPGQGDGRNLKGTCRTLDRCFGDGYRSQLENGLISRSGWAVIDDSPRCVRPDGSRSLALVPDETGVDWVAPRDDKAALDLYFMGYGHDYKQALKDYTLIAGKMPLPPDYAFGYWYSKYENYSADDYRNIIKNLKDNDINTDVIILDMDWHWNGDPNPKMSNGRGGWTGWSWNTNLIPDPTKLLKDIHGSGLHLALNLHPALGVDSSEDIFLGMATDMGLNPDTTKVIPWKLEDTNFYKAFANNFLRPFEKQGVDFWWLDWQQHLTSPYTSGLGQTFWCNHVFYNDMATNRPDRRPVIFHRWGGLGSHRYQIGFSGDALINFPTLAFQPYFTSTASNVGYGYWGHDLGGHAFTDEKTVNDPELVLRWVQFGVFTPIFRTHATNDSRIERRLWKFPNFPDLLDAVRLRYTLFPYIYTMAREAYDTGISMCRPLYYEYPDMEEAYSFDGEYFFGNDILVAPVTEASKNGVSTKTIWFPEGNWWSVATNQLIEGPCTMTMNFSSTDIPYFYRQGSIVPLNPASVKNVTERPGHMIFDAVAGKEGKGSLYEDAGDNNDYDTAFATTSLTQTSDGNTHVYTIHPRVGVVDGLPASRSYTLRIFNVGTPEAVSVNGSPSSRFSYIAEKKCAVVEIPEGLCSSAVTVEIRESASGVADVAVSSPRVFYDKASDTLTAEFGQTRKNVELAMFDLTGMECLSQKYQNISGFSEKLSMLSSPQLYVCKITADSQVAIEKIFK